MENLLWHDDYEWNQKEQHSYKSKEGIAKNLHQLLFWCPKCKTPLMMASTKDTLYCKCCNSGIKMDDKYNITPLTEDSVVPKTPSYWFDLQREWVKEQVKDENFVLEENVKLGILPKYELLKDMKTSEIVGEGIIRITRKGLSYVGTREGKEFNFDIPSSELSTYGMCTDVTRIYTFYKSEFLEFYPERESAEYLMMATEEIHYINNGPWKNFSSNHPYWDRLK